MSVCLFVYEGAHYKETVLFVLKELFRIFFIPNLYDFLSSVKHKENFFFLIEPVV